MRIIISSLVSLKKKKGWKMLPCFLYQLLLAPFIHPRRERERWFACEYTSPGWIFLFCAREAKYLHKHARISYYCRWITVKHERLSTLHAPMNISEVKWWWDEGASDQSFLPSNLELTLDYDWPRKSIDKVELSLTTRQEHIEARPVLYVCLLRLPLFRLASLMQLQIK